MFKKVFTIFILGLSFFMPIFGVSIHIPWHSDYLAKSSDYNVKNLSDTEVSFDDSTSQKFLLKIFDYINQYLWWAFSAVCTAVVIYWWYRLITSNWDKKALKQWVWALIWSGIGIVIAMLSYMLIDFLANLKIN
jgi:hypothetical protein